MKPTIKRLSEKLVDATDGVEACGAIDSLAKHARKGDADAKTVLGEYMLEGAIEHMRDHACSCLAELVDDSDSELVSSFESGLSDQTIRYWSILGFSNAVGSKSYKRLTELVQDTSVAIEDRSHAVKCLAAVSQQTFDRDLPDDPGEWEESDIRLDEIIAWAQAGSPGGIGYELPSRHPALDHPKTSLEKIASRLEKRLAKQRGKERQGANPTNWLAVSDIHDLETIASRWKLPAIYRDFLARFGPVNVTIENRRFSNGGLRLFGVADLIEAQHGYAFNPVTNKNIRGWRKSHLVVARHGGDPFVLDLKSSDGSDAPVLTAEHGTGSWEFDEIADSFEAFLKSL